MLEHWLAVRQPGDRAWIAARSPIKAMPQSVLGIDFHYWLWPLEHLPGRGFAPRRDPMWGYQVPRAIKQRLIERVAIASYDATAVRCGDGSVIEPDLVVFATGFAHDTRHLGALVERIRQGGRSRGAARASSHLASICSGRGSRARSHRRRCVESRATPSSSQNGSPHDERGHDRARERREQGGLVTSSDMTTVCVTRFGGPEVLEFRREPVPAPAPGEVLVRIEAVGLDWSDVMQREGTYPGGATPPFRAGQEAAAVVVAHGAGVTAPPLGTRVSVLARNALAAELAVVPAESCIVWPCELSAHARAALPVALLTAYHALAVAGRARAGEVALVTAAAGGLGHIAIQLARVLGLVTLATCSEHKRAVVEELGARVCMLDQLHRSISSSMASAARPVVLRSQRCARSAASCSSVSRVASRRASIQSSSCTSRTP